MRRKVFVEVVVLWLVTLLIIRGVVSLQAMGLPDVILAAVPFLFVYMPVWLCRWRGVDPDHYALALPAFRDTASWWDALKDALGVIGPILVPWLIGYHLYQSVLFGFSPSLRLPKDALLLIPYHLFYVAIPEEFFYRGYFQERLNEVFPKRWQVFGVSVGPSLLITCLFFAFGHSLVTFRWWHFAIFFPSLVFGWLREKSKGALAGAFFHAWCNITVAFLDALYGIR